MPLLILTTGGTIDKVYFDASSEYEVGEPTVPHVFREAGVTLEWRIESLFRKDSLELTGDDRAAIRRACDVTSAVGTLTAPFSLKLESALLPSREIDCDSPAFTFARSCLALSAMPSCS